ncbi:MAG: DUF1501 domain-containing protein [Halothiobacillaceae bacterium]|nr:DUF1501 domain-containing protein [Halothiobacillaceae bacterium]
MKINHLPDMARRAFLQRSAALGITGTLAPWALQLSMLGEASAAVSAGTHADDYKALVCIFLNGGNDNANTLVPVDIAHYDAYAAIRSSLATGRDQLLNTALTSIKPLADGLQFALAPELAPLKPLWDARHLAVQLNVGSLIVPTSVAQFKSASVPLPPKLFSHNDQTSLWQSGMTEGARSGWGGRMGDLLLASNRDSVFTCISTSGNAIFLSGKKASQYQINPAGAIPIRGIRNKLYGSEACQAALQNLITQPSANIFGNEYAHVVRRSVDTQTKVASSLAGQPALKTHFDKTNPLAKQLEIVARLIGARASLGAKRQVFLVSLNGFDTHDNLLDNHPTLLANIANAMRSFYDATVELGVAQNVTTFTASDFGRTFTSNGDGSDHGWGSHHFVMGGAVKGQQFYGTAPAIAVNGPDDVGQGRLLPTTSVDQYAASFASWMGIPSSEMAWVMPNIGNFSGSNLGFV